MYLTSAAAAPRSGIAPVGDWAGAGAVVFPPPLAGEGTVGACGAYGNRLAGLGEDLDQLAAGGRRDFGIDFIRGDLDQGFAFSHRVARLFQPLGDGPLRDRLTHFWQGDLHGRLGHDRILPSFQRLNLTTP